jgi:PAS domain S-box-containing protein
MNHHQVHPKSNSELHRKKGLLADWLIGQSIKRKLKLIIMSVSSLGIIFAGITLLIIQRTEIRQNMASDLNTLSEVIAENSEPAVIFGDQIEAVKILSTLSKKKSIRIAILYDSNNEIFASSTLGYEEDTVKHLLLEETFESRFTDSYFEIKKPIVQNGKLVGTLYLKSDLTPIESPMNKLMYSILIMFVVLELLAYFLASYVQQIISYPIISLAEIARKISREEDYSLRAEVFADDEVGNLTDDFNYMLSQVELRESALKESEQRFQSLIEHAVDAIYLFDLQGNILHINPSACSSLGYKEAELLQMTVNDIDVNLMTIEEPPQSWKEIESNQSITVYSEFSRKSGSIFPVEIHFGRFEFEKESFILAFARDVTQRKQAEAALKQSNDDLEFKVEQRTEELSLTNKELTRTTKRAESANKAKSEFLANMSHEIRTPLNAVLGFTDLLRESELAEKQASYVESIQAGARGLLTIINDVLDLSKIEAGKLLIEYEPVDAYEFIDDIEKIFSQSIRAKNLDFEIIIDKELPEYLVLDQTRIRQILFNLLGNAIKFTERGFIRIHINYRESAAAGQRMEKAMDIDFAIQDSGIGIAADQLNRIFDEFVQHEGQSNAKFGGTGIGLSICRKLAKMLGGEIIAKSEQGVGSTFTLKLKGIIVGKNLKTTPVTVKESPIEFEPASILLVDDIQSNRTLIKEQFFQTNLNFSEAINGLEAIHLANNKTFDLIIMDIRMPIMDGIAATRHLKSDRQTKHIPIVALTASVSRNERYKLEHCKFDKILLKPIRKQEVAKAFREFLKFKEITVTRRISEAKVATVEKPTGSGRFSMVDSTQQGQMLRWLKGIQQGSYQDALSNGMISAIDEFASELLSHPNCQLAPALYQYASSIRQSVSLFNIDQIEQLMPKFNVFIEQLEAEICRGIR